jgi:hypothetical protein
MSSSSSQSAAPVECRAHAEHLRRHGWVVLTPKEEILPASEIDSLAEMLPAANPAARYLDLFASRDIPALNRASARIRASVREVIDALLSEYGAESREQLVSMSRFDVIHYAGPGPGRNGFWHADEGVSTLLSATTSPSSAECTEILRFRSPEELAKVWGAFFEFRARGGGAGRYLLDYRSGPYEVHGHRVPSGYMGVFRRDVLASPEEGEILMRDPAPTDSLVAMLEAEPIRPPPGSVLLFASTYGAHFLEMPALVHRAPPDFLGNRFVFYQHLLTLGGSR